MENNKSQFKRTGVLHDGAECIEIQINHSGDAARYVSTIMFTVKDPEVTTSRNKSIKCESFTICCRLNLSGLQENKLMSMQQE